MITVGIEYPWLPTKCKKCRTFGHATYACTKIEKQVRITRKPEQKKGEIPSKVIITEKRDISPTSDDVQKVWTEVRSKRTPGLKAITRGRNEH